jgi:predicted nucleotidyltransferase
VFLGAMRDAALDTHRPERSFHHYVHMARRNYREYLRGETVRLKKYLYVLRPLLAALWIERGRGVAPMRFTALVDGIVTDAGLRMAIEQLPAINAFVDAELTRLEAAAPPASDGIDFSVLDRLLTDTVLRLDAANSRTHSC